MELISQTELYIFGVCVLILLFIITIYLIINTNNISRVLLYLDDESTLKYRRHDQMVKTLKDSYQMTREKLSEISIQTKGLKSSSYSSFDLNNIDRELGNTNIHLRKISDKLDVIINKD